MLSNVFLVILITCTKKKVIIQYVCSCYFICLFITAEEEEEEDLTPLNPSDRTCDCLCSQESFSSSDKLFN